MLRSFHLLVKLLVLFIVISALFSSQAFSQSKIAKVNKILKRHKKSLGDHKKLLESKVKYSIYEINVQGRIGEYTSRYEFPYKYRSEIKVENMKAESGCDGDKVWSKIGSKKVVINEPLERSHMFNDMYMTGYCYLRTDADYGNIELRADTIIKKEDYNQLTIFPNKGDSIQAFFHAQTGRLEYIFDFAGDHRILMHYLDFRKIDGIEVPCKQVQSSPEAEIFYMLVMSAPIESFKDDYFDIPE